MTHLSQKLAYVLLLGSVLVNPHTALAADATVDPAYAASVMSSPTGLESPLPANSLPTADQAPARYTTERVVTAYTSTVGQCDSTPFTTANGTTVHDGVIAANWLKFGTRVRIPAMFGDKVFIVADRMNPRFDDRMDIWMSSISNARVFGVRHLTIEVL